MNIQVSEKKIAVVGLGYVGLPLAIEFAKKYSVVGFDIDPKRVEELSACQDHTREADIPSLRSVINDGLKKDGKKGLSFTSDHLLLKGCNFYIITVPTPVDKTNSPDLSSLLKATEMVGSVINRGDIIVYESTVYPGCTEEKCVPVIAKSSGLLYNQDFFCGYSPERINPGDKEHTLTKIKKITFGSTLEVAKLVDELYASIITAGTHPVPSIKIAEAAKVIENAQRDINIAFVNELSKIFNLLDIDTLEVLEAAATKWNFLDFKPGLVGGHCIGIDPYYLAQKALAVGYDPEIILAGRKLNDSMGSHVAERVIKLMTEKSIPLNHSDILVLGITFKENFPDIRNTKVVDIVNELISKGAKITICDPWADSELVKREYQLDCCKELPEFKKFDAVIFAVGHKIFAEVNYKNLLKEPGVIFDVKGMLDKKLVDGRL